MRERSGMLAAAVLVALCGCGGAGGGPRAYGEPVETERARRLSEVVADLGSIEGGASTVVSGRIGEVCRAAGCWFVLVEREDERLHELLIDLQGSTFTVPVDVMGKPAIVQGRILTGSAEPRLNAEGLVVLEDGDG